MVLLKFAFSDGVLVGLTNLHSTMVLLKFQKALKDKEFCIHLHSTMVLLKSVPIKHYI